MYNDYIHLLNGEYKEKFQDIEIYISSSGYKIDDFEDIMEEILDLFISAQEEGKPIKDVIGENMENFCNQIINSHTQSLFDRTLSYFDYMKYIVLIECIFEVFNLIFDYTDQINNPLLINVEIGIVFIIIFVSFIITLLVNYIRKKLVFRYKWFNSKLDTFIIIILVISIIFLPSILPDSFHSLIKVPRYIFIPLSFIFFVSLHIRKKRQKKINNNFSDLVYNETILTYRKQYEKYINKCKKNNKEILDLKEWYNKKYKKEYQMVILSNIFSICIILGFVIFIFLTNELFDSFIYLVIVIVIEIPIFHFFRKSDRMRSSIYKEINEKNTDIYDDSILKNI